jgi:hypothetical protein
VACDIFAKGWHFDDINLRLGYTIGSSKLKEGHEGYERFWELK